MVAHWKLALVVMAVAATWSATVHAVTVSLNLPQALELARRHSPRLKDRGDEVAAARHRVAQAQARTLPRLGVAVRYTRVNHVEPGQISVASPLAGVPAPPPVQLGEAVDNQASMRLTVDQPLFVGHVLSSAKEASEYIAQAAIERARQEQNDLELRVEEAYLAALLTAQFVEVADRSVKLLEQLHREATQREKVGSGTQLDVERSRARLLGAESALLQAQASAELAAMNLATLLGLDLASVFQLAELPPLDGKESTEEILQVQAAQQRPELAIARAQAAAQKARLRSEVEGQYPQLWLRGGVSYDLPNQRYFPLRNQFEPSWDISAVASWNWDWSAAQQGARAAAAETAVAERQIQSLGEAVSLEVARFRKALVSAQPRVRAADSAVSASEIAVHRARDLCALGHSSCTQILDAERDLSQALAEQVQARAEFRLAQSRLRRAVGGHL
jgi:outer membrane protein